MGSLARMLIFAGILFVLLGALLLVGERFGLGKLPGDLTWKGKNWTVNVPIMTSILISLVLTRRSA